MNPQRLVNPAMAWSRRSLVPFITPAPALQEFPLCVTARMLSPRICDAQHYQLFQRWTKSLPSLNIKTIATAFQDGSNEVFCDTVGSYLFVNFGTDSRLDGTAVVFADGALITWFMPKEDELRLATNILEISEKSHPNFDDEAVETIQVDLQPVDGVSCLVAGESILLTSNDERRSDEMLAISMAIASAVRMNALEHNLSRYIENGHSDLLKLLKRINNWKLSSISESVFTSEKGVHNWRYFLNNVHQNSVPDVLWEYESLNNLFQAVSNNFDLSKRFVELQSSLTHYHEYLLTVGEYVRHRYSSRLEKIIILIIAIETALAFRHALVDLAH